MTNQDSCLKHRLFASGRGLALASGQRSCSGSSFREVSGLSFTFRCSIVRIRIILWALRFLVSLAWCQLVPTSIWPSAGLCDSLSRACLIWSQRFVPSPASTLPTCPQAFAARSALAGCSYWRLVKALRPAFRFPFWSQDSSLSKIVIGSQPKQPFFAVVLSPRPGSGQLCPLRAFQRPEWRSDSPVSQLWAVIVCSNSLDGPVIESTVALRCPQFLHLSLPWAQYSRIPIPRSFHSSSKFESCTFPLMNSFPAGLSICSNI